MQKKDTYLFFFIKASLANIQDYYLSLLRMPPTVVERVRKLWCNFSSERREDNKKVHLVNWKEVSKSKEVLD